MKKFILFSVVLIFFQNLPVKSQNLVPNYSFEIDTACPGGNKIYYALPWFQPSIYLGNTTNSSSSDLCCSCQAPWNDGVPVNINGYQFARTDTTYAGIYCYIVANNTREYIEVPLLDTLIHNHNYCVEYYVSLANDYGTAISNMGAYFSSDSLLDNTYHTIDYVTPQVENSLGNMLNDTANWMLVSGTFIANGGEKFMTIGNFHLPANTNAQLFNGGALGPDMAYYYIDDVSVTDCGSVGINEITVVPSLNIFPNPSSGIFNISQEKNHIKKLAIKIYSVLGELIYQTTTETAQKIIDLTNLESGVYFVQVTDEKNALTPNKGFTKIFLLGAE